MRAVEETALQRRCDALRVVARSERPEDALYVFSEALEELQEVAREEMQGLMDLRGDSIIYGMEYRGEGQQRQEWNRGNFKQTLQLLHRAEVIGDEVCSYCVKEDVLGHSIRESRDRRSTVSYLQPPLTVAEMLARVRNTNVLLQEIHAYLGRAFPNSSHEDNTAAIEYAKRAYILGRRVAAIAQKLRTEKPLKVASSADNTAKRLTAIESECNTLQFARNEMQIGVLNSLVGKHEAALKNARAAIQLLTSIVPNKGMSASRTDVDSPRSTESRRLLAVAFYNLGCQLEQLITVDLKAEDSRAMLTEKRLAFERALQLGDQYLEPGHPLMQELQQRVSFTQAATTKGTPESGGKGGGLAASARRAPSLASPQNSLVHLIQPPHSLPTLPQLCASGRRHSHALNFSVPIGIYDIPSIDSVATLSGKESTSVFGFKHSLRDRIADLQMEQSHSHAPSHLYSPPSTKVSAVSPKSSKRKESSTPMWSQNKKKQQKQVSEQSRLSILNCHRLRRPSDALRLGGVSVMDTLFLREHQEAEAEKERKKEEKRMRRRKRRERSFLPENWSLVEDGPVAPRKKEPVKKKWKRSRGKRYSYKTAAGGADGEGYMDGSDEDGGGVAGFVFPDSNMKKRKRRQRKAEGGHEEESEEEYASDGERHHRQRERKGKDGSDSHDTLGLGSFDSGTLMTSLDRTSNFQVASDVSDIITSSKESYAASGAGASIAKKIKSFVEELKKGEEESDEEEEGEEEEEEEGKDEDAHHELKGDEDSDEDDDEEEPETVEEARERCEIELLNYNDVMYVRRVKAALQIQCAWRCNRARKELRRRQQILYREVYRIQKAAAMCIGGFFCIVLERQRLFQRQERCAAEVEARIAREEKVLRSALIIARHAKIFLQRRRREHRLCKLLSLRNLEELRVQKAAATMVARWWRIVFPQRAYWQRRTSEIQQQKAEEAENQRRQFAAVQLQRYFRGLLGRREAQQWRQRRVEERRQLQQRLRECTDLVMLCLQEYTRRCERVMWEAQQEEEHRKKAAVVIQIGWRAALQRQMMQNVITRCRRIVRAVLSIQRAYRRFCAGREIRYLRRVQEAVQHERIDRECYEYRATLTLQCFARMVLAKRAARHRRAAIGRGFFFAAIAIQSVCRGGTTRQQLRAALQVRRRTELLLRALADAQRARVADVTLAFLQARASGFMVEVRRCRRLTEKLYLRRRVRWELLREKSAAVIQRAFRKMRRRRQEREAAERQQRQRAFVLRCVIRIQALLRGALARREYRYRRYLARRQQNKREDMEEVMLQCFVDEWRAALLQDECDRRRIKVMEMQEREVLEYYGKMSVGAAAAALAEAAKKASGLPTPRTFNEYYYYDEDADRGECALSTYRDDL